MRDWLGEAKAGVKVEHARQRISAGLATPNVAEALELHTGSPLIELVRVVYDQAGRGIEHLHALYRPDRYAFEIDLVRSGTADTKAWAHGVEPPGQYPYCKDEFAKLDPQNQSGGFWVATLNQQGELSCPTRNFR